MKFLFLGLLILAMNVSAKVEQYQIKGAWSGEKEGQSAVEFSLNWTEEDGLISGVYQDNYYTQKAFIKGIAGKHGRLFLVTLPSDSKGIRSLAIVASDLKGGKGASLIPVSGIFRDEKGNPIIAASTEANLIGKTLDIVAQRQEENRCHEGFGAVSGYCGIYEGVITEEDDAKKKCGLLAFNRSRLVFDENGELGLALGETSNLVATPIHRIGRIFADPDSTRVEVLSRFCNSLDGTSFAQTDCKRLVLEGKFSELNKNLHFTGSYTILDEKTNESCRYSLSMDRSSL